MLTTFVAAPPPTIARCAAVLADAGAGMAAEFSPLGPGASIPATLDLLDAAGAPPGAAVLVDAWHFFRGPSTWHDLETVPLERVAYVQLTDALEPVSGDAMGEKTMNRRALPGDGVFALERFASTLLASGWEGIVSVEVLNRELAARPVEEVARLAHDATAPYWT